ncbi:hypothetical protein GC194_00770 [bacterium]|nr:hypothetical protein [bacterium]
MNKWLLYYCLFAAFIISSCGTNSHTGNSGAEKLTQVNIKFAKIVLPLPPSFKTFTANNLLEQAAHLSGDTVFNAYFKNLLVLYELEKTPYLLAHDTSDMGHFVHIKEINYVPLNKQIGEIILAHIKSETRKAFRNREINTSFTEQRYMSAANLQMMKVVTELQSGALRLWQTTFLLSTANKSILITHNTFFPFDIEDYVKSIKMY